MDIFEAAYRTAHDHQPQGAVGLARRLGKNPGTFLNELNPGQEGHKLGLGDATAMQTVSGDHRILHAMAHTLGEVCFALPDMHAVSDQCLLGHITKIGAESGDFYRVLHIALADGKFSRRDYRQVKQEAMEYIAAIAEAVHRIEGIVDEEQG